MLKFELEKKINMVEDLVFSGKFNEASADVLYIVESIETKKKYKDKTSEKLWKQLLHYIMISLENKDYLLVSDILKYELKPILNNLVEEN